LTGTHPEGCFARCPAFFEKHAPVVAKTLMNEVALPADQIFPPSLTAFFTSHSRPGHPARAAVLLDHGLRCRSEIELQLGRAVGEIAFASPE
jgi:hypothetical protein